MIFALLSLAFSFAALCLGLWAAFIAYEARDIAREAERGESDKAADVLAEALRKRGVAG